MFFGTTLIRNAMLTLGLECVMSTCLDSYTDIPWHVTCFTYYLHSDHLVRKVLPVTIHTYHSHTYVKRGMSEAVQVFPF